MNQQMSNWPNRSKNLIDNVKKSIQTTIIGAISKIEREFGYLWGHGKEKDKLTENEQKFLKIWLKLRKDMLDCSGNESRRMDKEFDKYVIQYNNYQYKFKVRGSRDERNGNV